MEFWRTTGGAFRTRANLCFIVAELGGTVRATERKLAAMTADWESVFNFLVESADAELRMRTHW
jgi:hypothetical protein